MSNKSFKAQASSSRAAVGGGFGGVYLGVGSAPSSGSVLSYLTPPPDIQWISDPNVVVSFKSLSKKDAITKTKALEDLRAFIQSPPEFQTSIESAILEAWVQHYPKLGIDNSRRVRELAHQIQYDMTTAVKKRMEKHMPEVISTWLVGILDRDRAVAKTAMDGLVSTLKTDDKVQKCWRVYQPEILEYARTALDETPQSLCDDRSMSADDIQETYLRVMGSSASLVEFLLSRLNKSDLLKHQDKYKLYFENDPKKLWGLISCADAFVRKLVAQLLVVCLKKQHGIVEANLELISKTFIAEALSSSQSASAFQLIQALEPLTKEYPEVWVSLYKAKKPVSSKLLAFVAKGSQGGPAAYWQSLQGLLTQLPDSVLSPDIDTSIDLFAALRDGINSREEHRSNAEQAWTSYFQIADFLVKRLPDETSQGKLFQEAVFPIFEHYIHPSVHSSKWSLGQNTPILAKAFVICASTADTALRRSLTQEWQRLADEFISRIRTSLPEQSKDYEASQASIVAEGQRWFSFMNETCKLFPNPEVSKILEQHSSRIIEAALTVTSTRNGKAYSAAATVDAALRLTPRLFRIIENMNTLKTFIEQNFNPLLLSPSMKYLVSILHAFHNFPEQKSEFPKFWQSAVCSVLRLPEEESEQKLQIIVALTASHSVKQIALHNQELQEFLYKMCIKALHGDEQSWLIFETAVTFNTIGPAQATLVLHAVVSGIDSTNLYAENALQALDLMVKKNPDFLQDHTMQMMLLTKLLALSEVTHDIALASKAMTLRLLLAPHEGTGESEAARGRVVRLVRGELESASPQSLLVGTLFKEAQDAMKYGRTPEAIASFFPKLPPWGEALAPFLQMRPSLALGVLRPFAGAVFLISDHQNASPPAISRDSKGYSVALRMALFVTRLLGLHELTSLVPQDLQSQYLYYLALTYELVNDQINLLEKNKLFESHLNPDSMDELRRMLKDILLAFGCIIRNARSWRDEVDNLPDHDTSWLVRNLVSRFLEASSSRDPQGYYAGKALSRFLEILAFRREWNVTGGDEWLEHLGIMKTTTQNIFGASAILIGFGSSLRPHRSINNLCNRLISDIAVASPGTEILEKLVLLNSCLMSYDKDDAEIPVAQTRLISTVKQILSWSEALATTHIELASEACRTLHRLLPAIKDVYGSYWHDALNLSAAIWSSTEVVVLSNERLPAIGMSLEMVSILQNLTDANDDMTDALVQSNHTMSSGLIGLLKLQRSNDNLPLRFVDELLLRQSAQINTFTIADLSHLYPLLASDFPLVQSATFHVLQKALINAQEQISLNVALEGNSATIGDELLSLLLDAPKISNFDDTELELFPLPVRRYLLSWHLVFDSFSAASNNVRGDYSTEIDAGGYLGPFLKFMFDILGHSVASPLKLDKEGIDSVMIRNYDMDAATNSKSSEYDMHWLLVNLYYLSLKYLPGLVKKWYKACENRQTVIAVGAWTAKWFSALVVEDVLDDVAQWSEKLEAKSDEKTLRVKISKNSREVFAGYEIDDMEMIIVIRLPPEYPLNVVDVQSINRVAIPEKKWNNFIIHTQGAIQFTNGSIVDGLETFQKNVVGALKGHVNCAICYSTVSEQKKLPDRQCATCHNLFHNDCLHTWFSAGSTNTCPLCRNPFQYATANRSRGRT
ncbi:hypothetical protein N431DRAFT_550388 [Stipitochalara longipes BDJ]|nr:hypothetical protein N431DRAFT_550388 [Stipitochalara longipes BDJ]